MNTPKKPGSGAYGPISTRHQSPPPITRPELRAAFKAHGIKPRTATPAERETEPALPAQRTTAEPPPPWVGEMLAPLLERMAEREEDRRGRRDSIVDATEKADAAAENATVIFDQLTKWWKIAALVIGAIVVGGSACGSTVFGYLAASKAASDNTKGVATEAAKEAVKEAPKPIERERVIYVERVPTPASSAFETPGDR